MERCCDGSLSSDNQQPQINQSNSPLPQRSLALVDVVGLHLDHSFANSHQACTENTAAFIPNNCVPLSLASHELYNQQTFKSPSPLGNSDFVQPPGSFQSPFKHESYSHYSPSQHILKEEQLNPNLQTLLPNDSSWFSYSGNLSHSLYPNGTSTEHSLGVTQLDMGSSSNCSNSTTDFLQPNFSTAASKSASPSQSQFQSSPNSSRDNSLRMTSPSFLQGVNLHHELNIIQPQFQGHRRTPSEYSDVSVSSAHHSPNIGRVDLSEQLHSPIQNPLDSGLYQEVLGISNFSLSEPQPQHLPIPSPVPSPVVSPQPDTHHIDALGNYASEILSGFSCTERVFPQESFQSSNSDMGQAQHMVPPEINVEFAPASRQNSFGPPKSPQIDQGALTPPDKARRRRAFTDTTNSNSNTITRPESTLTVSSQLEFNPPGAHFSNSNRTLSPNRNLGAASPTRLRRQSTPSMLNREYVLGFADPEYHNVAPDSGNVAKRVQKHAATFQCSLCPKKFTRAYNLRSHLRTHTDERPFICSICSKAFARQHDRKRHEGLHSGEKKFVCKGELKPGGHWGCGRRFARADALGRHFRSEAGRVCILPLLEEEAQERQQTWNEQQLQNEQQFQNIYNNMQPPIQQMDANDLSSNFILPAALLAQYPALANLSMSALPPGDVGIEDDLSGRSSFDASGSEYYDEGDDGGYISSGPTPQQYLQLDTDDRFQ